MKQPEKKPELSPKQRAVRDEKFTSHMRGEHYEKSKIVKFCADNPFFHIVGLTAYHILFVDKGTGMPCQMPLGISKASEFHQIAPRFAWLVHLGADADKDYPKGGLSKINDAILWIARLRGQVDESHIRGLGAIMDNDEPVVNYGDRVITLRGAFRYWEQPVQDLEYVYAAPPYKGRIIDAPRADGPPPATAEECVAYSELAQLYPFSGMGQEFLSHCVSGIVGGAMRWHPQLFIAGEPDSGKSWPVRHIMKPLLGSWYEGATSATFAAAKCITKNSALMYTADEQNFTDDRIEAATQKKIDKLLRTATDENDGHLQSDRDGGVERFMTRCAVTRIANTGDLALQDRDRSIIINKRRDMPAEEWQRNEPQVHKLVADLSDKIRHYLCLPTTILCARRREEQVLARLGKTDMRDRIKSKWAHNYACWTLLSLPAAGTVKKNNWTLDAERLDEAFTYCVQKIERQIDETDDEASECLEFLNHALSEKVGMDRQLSLSSALSQSLRACLLNDRQPMLEKHLNDHGIMIDMIYTVPFVLFYPGEPSLQRLLKRSGISRTSWASLLKQKEHYLEDDYRIVTSRGKPVKKKKVRTLPSGYRGTYYRFDPEFLGFSIPALQKSPPPHDPAGSRSGAFFDDDIPPTH